MISFVLPAHNETQLIGTTLDTIAQAIDDLSLDAEMIVVNDASTDDTGAIAARRGARVIDVDHRQIAATRNSGAAAARGDLVIFVDADTLVPAATIQSALAAVADGAVAGGAALAFDASTPFVPQLLAQPFILLLRAILVIPGCFLFVRRSTFEDVGGFDEQYYAGEEVHLSFALSRQGPIAFVDPPVVTSGRKFHQFTVGFHLVQALRAVLVGTKRREHCPIWYSERDVDEKTPAGIESDGRS